MTSNTQNPNGAPAPVWQPMPQAADAGTAGGASTDDADIAEAASASTGPVEFAPGYASGQRAKAKRRRGGSTTALLMIGALIAVGGVGFAVGHNLGGGSGTDAAANGQNGFRPNGSFNPGQFGPNASGAPDRAFGGGSVTGTVESVTADSMTVKLANGQTVTVAIGASTTYHSQTSASSSQVTTGSTVIVQTTNGTTAGDPAAAASPGTGATNRTATDVTVTSK